MADENEDDSISEVPMHPLQLQLMQKLAVYPTSDRTFSFIEIFIIFWRTSGSATMKRSRQ
jgi:hypothetical protein